MLEKCKHVHHFSKSFVHIVTFLYFVQTRPGSRIQQPINPYALPPDGQFTCTAETNSFAGAGDCGAHVADAASAERGPLCDRGDRRVVSVHFGFFVHGAV